MSGVIEDVRKKSWDEGMKEGLEQGSLNAKIDTAIKMIQKEQLSLEDIAEYTELSLAMVKVLTEEIAVTVQQ